MPLAGAGRTLGDVAADGELQRKTRRRRRELAPLTRRAPHPRLGARRPGVRPRARLDPDDLGEPADARQHGLEQGDDPGHPGPAGAERRSPTYTVNQLYENVNVAQALQQNGCRRNLKPLGAAARRRAPAAGDAGRDAPPARGRASSRPSSRRARSPTRSSSTCSRTRPGYGISTGNGDVTLEPPRAGRGGRRRSSGFPRARSRSCRTMPGRSR